MPRQSSQTSAKATAGQKATPKTGPSGKSLTKKPSDLGSKAAAAARKSSQATKKIESTTKVTI